MSKKDKKKPSEHEEEFDNSSFDVGVLHGMYECHNITSDAISRLRKSLEDVWTIEWNGTVTPEKKAYMEKLNFALDTLTAFADIFQDDYDVKLDKLKAKAEPEYYEEEYYGNPT
jgi:hypothetical protein